MANTRRHVASLWSSSVVCLAILTSVVNAEAQTPAGQPDGPEISFLIDGVVPQGGFKQNVSSPAFGGEMDLLFQIGHSPIFVGFGVGKAVYGSETRHEAFSSTIPDVKLQVYTENSMVVGDLLLRVQPRTGRIRPYIDGLIGFNHLDTVTTVAKESGSCSALLAALFDSGSCTDLIASTTNLDDTTFAYGFGGGVQFAVNRQLSLDAGVRSVRVHAGSLGTTADRTATTAVMGGSRAGGAGSSRCANRSGCVPAGNSKVGSACAVGSRR